MARPFGSKNKPQDKPSEAPVIIPVSDQADPGALPIRRLRQLVKEHGAPGADQFDRDSLAQALDAIGYEHESPIPEQVEDYWQFANGDVGRGEVYARDPLGNWSAVVRPDGSATVTRHVPPLNGRPSGVNFKDPSFDIPDLEAFSVGLSLLLEASDAIFERSAAKVIADAEAEQERLAALEHIAPPEVDSTLWMQDRMYDKCPEWGFTGPHRPSVSDLPYKLAQAIGIAENDNQGVRKDWQQMSREVLGR